MLDSIYHMTLTTLKNHILACSKITFLALKRQEVVAFYSKIK